MSTPSPAKGNLHPRNRHQGRYDFAALIKACPELKHFVITNPYGNTSIDFANPEAVRVFNRALLASLYGVKHWDVPEGYLCPPVPGRADYIHGAADILASDNQKQLLKGDSIRVLDIGTGANIIYPLLGHLDYGWQCVGADIDPKALTNAQRIIEANALANHLSVRQQLDSKNLFTGIIEPHERFSLTLCNPPFHSSAEEAASGSKRKWQNLGKLDQGRKLPALNFGGQSNELWCPGGEISFLRRMARDSANFKQQVLWFTTLVSKAGNVRDFKIALNKAGALEVRKLDMAQGNKQSRFVAWTFLTAEARSEWVKALK